MGYEDLIGKSVFDFSNDAQLIYEITGVDVLGRGDCLTKEWYLNANGTYIKALHLVYLGEATNNKVLVAAALKLSNKIWREMHKENPGLIID